MLIAIISDIHDNIANLERFLEWAKTKKISKIICCGDVTSTDTLEVMSGKFTGTVEIVKGNAEIYSDKDIKRYPNIKLHGRAGIIKVGETNLGFCHEPFLIKKVLEKGRPEIIFYGHTHKPWKEIKDGVNCVNPGTLGGVFQKATFASFDTGEKKLKLHILDFLN